MKKSTLILLIIGIVCVVAGIVTVGVTLIVSDFKVLFNTETEYTEVTHKIEGNFSGVELFAVECDVNFLPDDGYGCRVICEESEHVVYTVETVSGVLKIKRTETGHWYERIGFFSMPHNSAITVYLPAMSFTALKAQTTSGSISVAPGFVIDNLTLESVSGRLNSSAAVRGDVSAHTVSGDITLSNISGGKVSVNSASGKLTLSGVRASDVDLDTVSGRVTLAGVVSSGKMDINSTSGAITLDGCDGADIDIESTSGDVSGWLLSEKHYITHSLSGHISTPNNTSLPSECLINTTSGDIRFTAAE